VIISGAIVTLHLQRIYHLNTGSLHVEFVGYKSNILEYNICDCGIIQNILYMICRNVYELSSCKVHNSSFNGLLIITVKLKDDYTSCMATMLLYTLQGHYLKKSCILFRDLLPSIISGPHEFVLVKPNKSTCLPCLYQLNQSGSMRL
jgi:hypothetical protein